MKTDENSVNDSIKAHKEAGVSDESSKNYANEVYARWGSSDLYKQSINRTKSYSKEDWERVKKESRYITNKMASLMDKSPESKEVQEVVGEYYRYMQNFYDCPPEVFRGLGEMYVADPRFKKHYDDAKVGLAEFFCDAMKVFAVNK